MKLMADVIAAGDRLRGALARARLAQATPSAKRKLENRALSNVCTDNKENEVTRSCENILS